MHNVISHTNPHSLSSSPLMPQLPETTFILGGIPQHNCSIYHCIRFLAGDPVAYLSFPAAEGKTRTVLIIRDIEMDRAGG